MEKKTQTKKSPLKTLIIVESPAKAHTIEKYLGQGYHVMASMGHLIDLPKSKIGVDIDDNFTPHYITVRGRGKVLRDLQNEARKAKLVLLASDNDREGEAIAWHLNNALKDKVSGEVHRIVFNEITPNAIKEAVKHPSEIVESRVNAQKARRVLDRLVGYNLSPILWKKVKGGLSAGRVQSVALRLICEREKEVESFIPEEFWSIKASFEKPNSKGVKQFLGELVKYSGEKPNLKNEKETNELVGVLAKVGDATVESVKESERAARPLPPFTTSKLQQASASRLGYTSKKTMKIAQELYEGLNIGHGRVGLITYMRTDSTRISPVAIESVRKWIGENEPSFLPEKPNFYAVGKGAQDAHEAIRPTFTEYTPNSIREYLTAEQYKLYSIIWERFVSSQMTNAKLVSETVEISIGSGLFKAVATRVASAGFYSVLNLLAPKEDKVKLPKLVVGERLSVQNFVPEQHFTQGPARYTDASMVKTLEEKGIGRPSTYAPIISVLLDRYYVTRENKQLVPTQLGRIISKILTESFPDLINEHFTSEVETSLDKIETNNLDWTGYMREFYFPFKKHVDEVMETAESVKGQFDEKTGLFCEKCGRPMVKKLGRFGFFYACSGFPECKNAKPVPLAKCPKEGCNGDIIERRTKKRGRKFYGCTNYPTCDFVTYFKPIGQYCPKCGWFLVEKHDKKNGSFKSCINPACTYLHSNDEDAD